MRVEDVLERLEGVKQESDTQWYARCPAHDDRTASLAVSVGPDGRVLLKCYADCPLADVVRALRIDMSDLFPSRDERALFGNGHERAPWGTGSIGDAVKRLHLVPSLEDVERWRDVLLRDRDTLERVRKLKGWTPGACAVLDIGIKGDRLTIPVRGADGHIVAVLRYWPTARPKMLASKGAPRVPLVAIANDDDPIWIVEGETDAVAMVTMGLNVIAAPGASAKARLEWLERVSGRVVFVCFDVDDAGRRAAQRWAGASRDAGATRVHVVELEGPNGYDVGNVLLERGEGARALLLELAEHADEWREPVKATRAAPVVSDDELVENAKPGEIILRSLSTIRMRAVRMLWRERIPRGRVGLIFGSPGQGKSTLMALLAAEITRDGGRVLIASAEDSPTTTLVPRMVGAGADIGLVDLISTRAARGETSLVLPRDLDELGARMRGFDLLVVDPLMAHLGDDVNTWSDQSVRHLVFAPLMWHAEHTDCAVAGLMHMNKSSGQDPLLRIGGSIGFGAAARFALLLGSHPADIWLDEGQRRQALVHVKASETARQPAMIFRRQLVGVDVDEDTTSVPVLELVDDQARVTAESILEQPSEDESGSFADAVEWLRGELADGPKLAKQLLKGSRDRGDFSERTLRRAKRVLGILSVKDTEGWWWERPAKVQ